MWAVSNYKAVRRLFEFEAGRLWNGRHVRSVFDRQRPDFAGHHTHVEVEPAWAGAAARRFLPELGRHKPVAVPQAEAACRRRRAKRWQLESDWVADTDDRVVGLCCFQRPPTGCWPGLPGRRGANEIPMMTIRPSITNERKGTCSFAGQPAPGHAKKQGLPAHPLRL